MTAGDDGRNLSIVLHDEHLPVASVMTTICRALSGTFDAACVGVDVRLDGNGGDTLVIGYRLMPLKASEGDQVGMSFAERRRASHCELLDSLCVPNGIKAISIALHSHWSSDLEAEFGRPASPSTVKRWRSEAYGDRYAGRERRLTGKRECVSRRLRRHNAIRVRAAGMDVRRGYRAALDELAAVNSGCHSFYDKPEKAILPFSYETFRRDCLAVDRVRCWPGRGTRRRSR